MIAEVHWETVTPFMRQVMNVVGESELASRFYLAGGTALALQLGHRRSVDLDFFSETDEVRPETHREVLRVLGSLRPDKAFFREQAIRLASEWLE